MPVPDLEIKNAVFRFRQLGEPLPEDTDFAVAAVATGDVEPNIETMAERLNDITRMCNKSKKDMWLVYPSDQLVLLALLRNKQVNEDAGWWMLLQQQQQMQTAMRNSRTFVWLPFLFFGLTVPDGFKIRISRRRFMNTLATLITLGAVGYGISKTKKALEDWNEEMERLESEDKETYAELVALKPHLIDLTYAIAAKKVGASITGYYRSKNDRTQRVCILYLEEKQARTLSYFLEDRGRTEKTVKSADRIIGKLLEISEKTHYKQGNDSGRRSQEARVLELALRLAFDVNLPEGYRVDYRKSWSMLEKENMERLKG